MYESEDKLPRCPICGEDIVRDGCAHWYQIRTLEKTISRLEEELVNAQITLQQFADTEGELRDENARLKSELDATQEMLHYQGLLSGE